MTASLPAIPNTIYPDIPEEEENLILLEIAQEFAEEVYAEIDEAYPNLILSPGVQQKPRERLQKYLLRIYEAYPTDPIGRMQELYLLLNPDYVDLYKQGALNPPLSRPWSMLIRVPRIFEKLQRDFRELYVKYQREQPV